MEGDATTNSIEKHQPYGWCFPNITLLNELIVYNSPTWCYACRLT